MASEINLTRIAKSCTTLAEFDAKVREELQRARNRQFYGRYAAEYEGKR